MVIIFLIYLIGLAASGQTYSIRTVCDAKSGCRDIQVDVEFCLADSVVLLTCATEQSVWRILSYSNFRGIACEIEPTPDNCPSRAFLWTQGNSLVFNRRYKNKSELTLVYK